MLTSRGCRPAPATVHLASLDPRLLAAGARALEHTSSQVRCTSYNSSRTNLGPGTRDPCGKAGIASAVLSFDGFLAGGATLAVA